MGFTTRPGMVRADFFDDITKKWKYTEELEMDGLYSANDGLVQRAVAIASSIHHPRLTVVVLEPYHEHSHPVMLTASQRHDYLENL